MKKLYIIGNGFDLHHKLKTSYRDFGDYLKGNNEELFELLENYIAFPSKGDFPSEEDNLWGNFEENLANLDIDEIIHDNDVYLPNISSEDFRASDLHAFPNAMTDLREKLTVGLIQNFTDFIIQTEYKPSCGDYLLKMDVNGRYLSFNYTNTLERIYSVDRDKIFYIHNSAFHGSKDIILGHGFIPEISTESSELPPDGLDEEEMKRWIEKIGDEYDYSYDEGYDDIMKYFKATYKPTAEIIRTNKTYFTGLANVEEIHIYGLSFSNVDLPYLKEIVKNVKKGIKWVVSYYSSNKVAGVKQKLESMGILNIEFIKLDELLIDRKQLKLDL